MSGHIHSVMPEIGGMLLVATGNLPVLLQANSINLGSLQTIILLLGGVASIVAIVDYCMKIHWKYTQIKKNKHERKQQQSTRDQHQA